MSQSDHDEHKDYDIHINLINRIYEKMPIKERLAYIKRLDGDPELQGLTRRLLLVSKEKLKPVVQEFLDSLSHKKPVEVLDDLFNWAKNQRLSSIAAARLAAETMTKEQIQMVENTELAKMLKGLTKAQIAEAMRKEDELPDSMSEISRKQAVLEYLLAQREEAAEPQELVTPAEALELYNDAKMQDGLSDDGVVALLRDLHVNRSTPVLSNLTMSMFWLCRWVEWGFPTVKISAKFAAAAALTKTSKDILLFLKSPWPCFCIDLPAEDVLYQFDTRGKAFRVDRIEVMQLQNNKWSFFLMSRSTGSSTFCTGFDSQDLGDLPDSEELNPLIEIEDRDRRIQVMAARIIVSTVCALTNQTHIEEVNKRDHIRYQQRKAKRRSPIPVLRVFKITEPINIDLTKTVCELQLSTNKKGRMLTLQHTVAGHQKRQAHGPGRLERKIIWIQPYWRGPEDAPIAVRPHILSSKASATEKS